MSLWQVPTATSIPASFLETVRRYTPDSDGYRAAQILWQRGIRDGEALKGYLDPDLYVPKSPFDFGQEMNLAVSRLHEARQRGEKVTIWGDFDADGVTATSVLWEGLGQFLTQHQGLNYYIPDRIIESHGLNRRGIDKLAREGTKLIVTCDTGSNNLEEIHHANSAGIDIIVTDHHTLPDDRPPVISILNPRYFIETHPLYNLSGVAVAYKLIEAMYLSFPDIPGQHLENLLDLVVIGLIADLVKLSGDCRYLAQRGIKKLGNSSHPGVRILLGLCQKTGDRPTDISFGIGPRINAVSRIHGDASFCVELLTSQDEKRCQELAMNAELANTRRKEIQQIIVKQVKKKLERLDLSTTNVIILEDPQWSPGILGLVAGQIAQEYYRPTILLSTSEDDRSDLKLAKGSARSVAEIDLYGLVASQAHLLHRFGGHPLAAGLSLPVDNLPLFCEGINQQLRQQGVDLTNFFPKIEADLIVTVADLSASLFKELKLIEPCGMGNPAPKLLIEKCWFTGVENSNIRDRKGLKVSYIKTNFKIGDGSTKKGFPGTWWGHYQDEISTSAQYDAVVELDYNPYHDRYEVRIIALKLHAHEDSFYTDVVSNDYLLDWRNQELGLANLMKPDIELLQTCPLQWTEIKNQYYGAREKAKKLALAYNCGLETHRETWVQLVGIAKYLSRTAQKISKTKLQAKLGLTAYSLQVGLNTLETCGIKTYYQEEEVAFKLEELATPNQENYRQFLETIAEEQFQKQYFSSVPLPIIQKILKGS
ncbi:MAG: hypothetical protein N5P05_003911 [Chroococcopsis gigantea SAG 12.99]|jgi:single-stranded-DNA-specific exonuclease|nr:single-stranded-DNA-specific exonuclease RecJ [Chlorogloea purpurea SAG 13.99]MDV3002305.1 hypothetical protein [Chroococcopsis gigantea SAG 12.99]